MKDYHRKNQLKLVGLRLFFFIALTVCIYFFINGNEDYGFVTGTAILLVSVIPVTTLRIRDKLLRVTQYYFFALVPRSTLFEKGDNIEIYPIEIELSDTGFIQADSWYDLFFAFSPLSKASFVRYVIKKTDEIGDVEKVSIKLTEDEFYLIKNDFVKLPTEDNPAQ